MKIILSRKGFDSSNGGCPNPIFPDGTLLSLPIPSNDETKYSDLIYKGNSYKSLLKQINPKGTYKNCHLNPDIRSNVRKNEMQNWKPAFGQINQAQTYLAHCSVKKR